MKKCKKCNAIKSHSLFTKKKASKDGLDPYCKECKQALNNKWLDTVDREKIKETKRICDANWYALNKDKKALLNKKWKEENKEYVSEWFRNYKRNREQTDIVFKLTNKLRTRLWKAIKNNQKVGSAINELGCSVEELKIHLEAQFEPWMNWDNYGPYDKTKNTWNIDHILPLASFDLSNIEDIKKVCNYKNLRPFLALNNIIKKDN